MAAAAARGMELAAQLRQEAADLRDAAAAGAAATFEAASAAGTSAEVIAAADGSGRVVRLRIGPRAMKAGQDQLARIVVTVLNQALRGARERAVHLVEEAAGQGLAGALREAAAQAGSDDAASQLAGRLAGETVTAANAHETIIVTAGGTGDIATVRFGATALRGDDSVVLADELMAAANKALAETAGVRQRLFGSPGGADEFAAMLAGQVQGFDRRIEGVLDQLALVEQQISGSE